MNQRVIIEQLRDIVSDHFPDRWAAANKLLDQLEDGIPLQPILGIPRHKDWDKTAHAFLLKHPTCAACGTKKNLQVHHKKPFHLHRELELDPENLLGLCDQPYHHCHFVVGHLMCWSSYNPDVVEDAAKLLEKIRHRAS